MTASTLRLAYRKAFDVREQALVRRLGNLLELMEPGVHIALKSGEKWEFDRSTRTLTYPQQAALDHPLPYNLGVVCRELACQRYTFAPTADVMRERGCLLVWVAIESLRASTLLCARYAGARGLLQEVYAKTSHPPPAAPLLLQYACGAAALWVGQKAQLASCDPRVVAALALTRRHLLQAQAPPEGIDLAYTDLGFEQRAMAAQHAKRIVLSEIWPVLRDLAREDAASQPPEDGSGATSLEDLFGHLARTNIDVPPSDSRGTKGAAGVKPQDPSSLPPKPDAASTQPPELTQEQLEALGLPHDLSSSNADQDAPQTVLGAPGCRNKEFIKEPDPSKVGTQYDQLVKKHAKLIDQLTGELEDVFSKQRLSRYTGHFKSGRYDLKKAVAEKFRERATGVRDPKVFLRKDAPSERSIGFILCADISSSMESGESMTCLKIATTVLLEAGEQLHLPIGVLAYHTYVTSLKKPDASLSRAQANNLIEHLIPDCSNNELAALDVAQKMAEECATDEVYIVFITDGGGASDLPDAIVRLEQKDSRVRVIGVGIGAGYNEVPKLYKRHRQIQRVEDLPRELGRLFVAIHLTHEQP